jgi:outer membrane receptor for ferrienterochelin and colicin
MKKLFIFILFLISCNLFSQNFTLSGYVKDKESGETLINVQIRNISLNTVLTTNEYGYFSIKCDGKNIINIQPEDYSSKSFEVNLKKDSICILLFEPNSLNQIEIIDSKGSILQSNLGTTTLSIEKLKKIPTIGGEFDILKGLSLLPGISNGAEATSNIYVRGGTPDQNLIQIDGIPVYNINHLGGFFSVLNADAVKSIDLIKGNFPARYGGRLSSVVDINLKEGNNQKSKYKLGIGLVTSQFSAEGPITKNKSSYLAAARISYLGLLNILRAKKNTDSYLDYWLYDINFKVNHKIKDGNLFFSLYKGNDIGTISTEAASTIGGKIVFTNREANNIEWGNTTSTLRYSKPLSSKLFVKILSGYSSYKYKFISTSKSEYFQEKDTLLSVDTILNYSIIKDFINKIDFDFTPNNNHFIKFGLGVTYHNFGLNSGISLDSIKNTKYKQATESYIYCEDNINLNKNLTLNVGLRYSNFNTIETSYNYIEPRINLSYNLSKNQSIKAAYAKANQFLHLIGNNDFGFPNDIWVFSNKNISPQSAHQYSIGYFIELNKFYNFNIESYYKKMSKLIELQNTENLFKVVKNWDSYVEKNGIGNCYGAELFFEKKNGKLNGFISYTLSWADRKFTTINNGKKYPFIYDRRHNLAVNTNYQINKQWSLNFNFVFNSGNSITVPVAYLPLPNGAGTKELFGDKNNTKLPNYHRLDCALNYEKLKINKNSYSFSFNIYNLYNHKNTSYLRVEENPVFNNKGEYIRANYYVKKVSLIPLIPSFTFNYSF